MRYFSNYLYRKYYRDDPIGMIESTSKCVTSFIITPTFYYHLTPLQPATTLGTLYIHIIYKVAGEFNVQNLFLCNYTVYIVYIKYFVYRVNKRQHFLSKCSEDV